MLELPGGNFLGGHGVDSLHKLRSWLLPAGLRVVELHCLFGRDLQFGLSEREL